MNSQAPILIVVVPLLMSLVMAVVGMFRKTWVWPLVVTSFVVSFLAAVKTLMLVKMDGEVRYMLAGWQPPYGIEYVVDHLNGLVLVMVTFVALITALYSKASVEKELGDKIVPYYVLFTLLVTGLLGITITGDAFNLYVLLEIAALTSYGLMALGRGRAYMSTFNYLIMGTMGACFYLLGVGYLFIKTGSLNMTDISKIIPLMYGSQAILVGFIFIMIGVWMKMAFFPLHSWLPNAYTNAPTATSALVAPLMTKVSVYVMLRMMYTVFSGDYVFNVLAWKPVVMAVAVIAILVGSAFALMQTSLKKMLTYLVVAEIGYMVGGAWLGNQTGVTGATYHILADALMTSTLFMAVGCIVYKTGKHQLSQIKGLFRRMPWTMAGLLLGGFSMIGIPPTCGFFSKWYLIKGALISGDWAFIVALLLSSLVNAILFFRIIEIGFFAEDDEKPALSDRDEAPAGMLVPMLIMAVSLVVLGLFTREVVSLFIQHAVPLAGGL